LVLFGLLALAAPLVLRVAWILPAKAQILHANGPLPSFEVATIKPDKDGGKALGFKLGVARPADVVGVINVTARELIKIAYDLPFAATGRVLGGPGWTGAVRYDVQGKVPDALFAEMQKMTPEEKKEKRGLLLQDLLANRFKLKVHFETREMPIYELRVVKGAPKLTPSKELPATSSSASKPGNPMSFVQAHGGTVVIRKAQRSEMIVRSMTLQAWAQGGALGLERPVVNKTGLEGKYDFTLDWSPDLSPTPPMDGAATPNASEGPSLFTAIEEQLGLKLTPVKGPVEVIVIDHIENPSPN
jgi:uncharacterized protein (TIGR03435 family)